MIEIYTGDSKKDYEYIGLVNSSEFFSKNAISDFGAGIRSLVGGKVGAWSKMQEQAFSTAKLEVEEKARQLGADAILFIRFDTVTLGDTIGVVAYGTAVKYK